MQRHSISLVSFCLMFGVLLGAAGLLSVAVAGGLIELDETTASEPSNTYMSATERLEAYRCRPAETKQIIMGGVEDDYSSDGDEPAVINAAYTRWKELAGGKWRRYDEAGQDKNFVDQFDIPNRTYHGLVAIGVKELSSIHNDFISLSVRSERLLDQGVHRLVHQTNVSELGKFGWQRTDTYYWAQLSDLKVKELRDSRYQTSQDFPHLLSALRDRKIDEFFTVEVSDDTMVDFIGFALCLEPEEKKGLIYSPDHYLSDIISEKLPEGQIFLSASVINGKLCQIGGCLSCDIARPVACIKDENLPAPDEQSDLNSLWSGGYIDFTPAISGSSFNTEDDVDAYCQKSLGDEWRHLNTKDGNWQGVMMGYGQLPDDHTQFWVGMKDSPHHNCWELRPDYVATYE